MVEAIKKVTSILCVIGGLLLIIYGGAALLGLDSVSLNKFSSGGRDTGSAVFAIFGGLVLLLFGSMEAAIRGPKQ